eukprot:scpid39333/ scgid18501/ 
MPAMPAMPSTSDGGSARRNRLYELAGPAEKETPDVDESTLSSAYDRVLDGERMAERDLALLEERTREQHLSEEWHAEHIGRITSSVVHRVLRMRQSTSPDKLVADIVGLSKTTFKPGASGGARQHGHDMEDTARNHYISYMEDMGEVVTVSQHGLFVSSEYPYIGTSVDGLVHIAGTDDCGVLEIKCPASTEKVEELVETRKSFFLKSSNGVLSLKKSHQYFSQVQMEMAVTGHKWTDFVVFTTCDGVHSIHVERIAFDEEFWKENLEKIHSFYRKFVVLELVTRRLLRNLSLLASGT